MMSKVTRAVIGRAGMDTTLLLSWAALTVLTDDGDDVLAALILGTTLSLYMY